MNVLVYSGPGVSQTSLTHTLSSLRTLLLPNYAVNTITAHALANQPWASTCALLVIPGGRDLPYLSALSPSMSTIKSYVHNGGAYLGLCAGAYFASKRVEWEVGTPMEVSGDRPLRFFDGICRGCVYPGFQYETEDGARAVNLDILGPGGVERMEGLYYNGGGEFVDAANIPNAKILAKYVDDEGAGKVAGVSCLVERGRAVLWAIHPEYPLTREPANLTISRSRSDFSSNQINECENRRWQLMRDTLTILGLQLPQSNSARRSRPLPQYLVSPPTKPFVTATILNSLSEHLTVGTPRVLKDTADVFHFHMHNENDLAKKLSSALNTEDDDDRAVQPKHIVVCSDGRLPSKSETPSFDIGQFFEGISKLNNSQNAEEHSAHWSMGEALLYGEVVTSTQTMLDQNPILLTALPTPLLSIAAQQLSGRGRGPNTWLSPSGCLQFSLLLRLPLYSFPPAKLVFIQYLFGLAVVQACRDESVLGKLGQRVRLKWPNDIYAVLDDAGELKKVGGILVNTSFSGGNVDIIIGCGLNVLNPPPITSMSNLIPPGLTGMDLTMERTAACIVSTFEKMWTTFIANKGSFDPFMDLYLDRWLHSDQLVTITTIDPPVPARIVGITPDHGLLRTVPEHSGSWSGRGDPYIDLQPDGNSFDLMSGLIRSKT